MFLTVSNADQFNSYINNKKFDLALRFAKEKDVKFSYIDSQSISCFDCIFKATFSHFQVPGIKLTTPEIKTIDKILSFLLDNEPHYWFKKVNNTHTEVYYFFNFFLQNNNLEKVKYFSDNIKKFNNNELEENYIYQRSVSVEMGELIRNNTETTKINIEEINLAYGSMFYTNEEERSTDNFISYLDDLIRHKKTRKLTYKHDEIVDFCLGLTSHTNFMQIFPKIVELFSPELFKNHKAKESIDEKFPFLSTRLDFLAARLFSCMNFSRTVNSIKENPIDKNLTLPLLSYLQTVNFKKNINDYIIGEFRYKFVPIALEFMIPSNTKDWPSDLGLSKEDGFNISSQYFSNFFVHLLADSLVSNASFTTEENKIQRLKEFKKAYPNDFRNNLEQFEEGLTALGLTHALNADINNIRLYFKMLIAEEDNTKTVVKSKKLKI